VVREAARDLDPWLTRHIRAGHRYFAPGRDWAAVAEQKLDVVKELRRPVNNPTNNGRSCGANASRLQMRQLLKASLVLSRCSPISQCLGAVA